MRRLKNIDLSNKIRTGLVSYLIVIMQKIYSLMTMIKRFQLKTFDLPGGYKEFTEINAHESMKFVLSTGR